MELYNIPAIKSNTRNKIPNVSRDLGLEMKGTTVPCLNLACRQKSNGNNSVNIDTWKNTFKCRFCDDVRGDVIDFVEKYTGLRKFDAIKYLAEKAGIEPVKSRLELNQAQKTFADDITIEINKYLLELCKDIPKKCEKWLNKKGITLEVIDRMSLGYIGDYASVSDALKKKFLLDDLLLSGLFNRKGNLRFFVHRLLIPYFKDNKPVYVQAYSLDGRYRPQELYAARQIPYPYNVDCLQNNEETVYLCEGIIDTLTLISKGKDAISIPQITGFKNTWISLFSNQNITIVFKGNHVNRNKAKKLMHLLRDHCIKADVIDLPSGETVNSFLLTHSRFDR